MTPWAVMWIASLVAIASGIATAPGHVLRGIPAVVPFLGLLVSGTVLCVHVL